MRAAQASVVELEKGKLYRVFVDAGRDPRTGKRRRPSKTVRGSRREAERVKMQMLAKVGADVPADMELRDFWEAMYLPDARERLREDTVAGYEGKYRLYLADTLGGFRLSRITPQAVTQMLDGIDGAAKRFEAFKILRQIMAKAVRWGMVAANPCDRVDVPKKPGYRPDVLTAEDAARYMEAFRGTRLEAAVLIAVGGGLRRSEICALDWADISEDGTVSVTHRITSAAGRAVDGAPKTEFSTRRVHLPRSVAERLNELRTDGAVVKNAKGERMHPDGITRNYIRIRETMPPDVPRVSLKNLRHTSLSLAIDAGVDVLAVSRRAGHASIEITSRYYLRPHDGIDAAAADALDALLSS